MKMSHVTGTKQEKSGASDWYADIETANIARIEAEQAALAALTAAAKDALPGQDARIDKGAALVAERAVWPLTDGGHLVGSESDTVKAYLVRRPGQERTGPHGWRCECKHFEFMGGLCKHIAAVWLSARMGAAYTPRYN